MFVSDAMSHEIITIQPTATVLEAASMLVNTRVSAVPVVDEQGALVGIVSEADAIKHIVLGTNVHKDGETGHRVSDIMTAKVDAVEETTPLKAAIELMIAARLKFIPVCRAGKVVGSLSRTDVMRIIASQTADAPLAAPRAVDLEVRDKVVAALQGHRWSLAQRFDVVVKDGTVHLWGVVPSDKVHQSYCEAARRASQPRAVVSHMHVMRYGVRMVHLE
jgi:CBS domain-containing protein